MTRGSLGGGVARGTLRWSVVVLRNGARADAPRGDALFSGTPRSSFPCCRQNTDPFAFGSFRTEILDSRTFDLFAFARFFHAESSLEIPRKIETHNLLNLNRGNCPSRSEADPRGQSKARKRGDIADVPAMGEAYAARGALPRHISTRVYASAQTHNHQNGLHVSLHEGRGRRE